MEKECAENNSGKISRIQEIFPEKISLQLFFSALFPIQVEKSFCYFNFKMAFRFLHRKNRNAAKRFGKKGWSLRRGKKSFPVKGFFPSSS
ncbi:MAG: hypothetical protein IKB25_07110, partial [Lentisphaeria bacterium]|nr:hypothetical protein [Lentisphaeria bacterium]